MKDTHEVSPFVGEAYKTCTGITAELYTPAELHTSASVSAGTSDTCKASNTQ